MKIIQNFVAKRMPLMEDFNLAKQLTAQICQTVKKKLQGHAGLCNG